MERLNEEQIKTAIEGNPRLAGVLSSESLQEFATWVVKGQTKPVRTYNRAFQEWKDNHIYLTELVMVLNHKIWQHHDKGDSAMSELYGRLWKEADHYACENLRGEEQEYFYDTTD